MYENLAYLQPLEKENGQWLKIGQQDIAQAYADITYGNHNSGWPTGINNSN